MEFSKHVFDLHSRFTVCFIKLLPSYLKTVLSIQEIIPDLSGKRNRSPHTNLQFVVIGTIRGLIKGIGNNNLLPRISYRL